MIEGTPVLDRLELARASFLLGIRVAQLVHEINLNPDARAAAAFAHFKMVKGISDGDFTCGDSPGELFAGVPEDKRPLGWVTHGLSMIAREGEREAAKAIIASIPPSFFE